VRVIARQIWWLQVMRITIGCAVIALGVLTPWLGVERGVREGDWRAYSSLLACRSHLRDPGPRCLPSMRGWNGGRVGLPWV